MFLFGLFFCNMHRIYLSIIDHLFSWKLQLKGSLFSIELNILKWNFNHMITHICLLYKKLYYHVNFTNFIFMNYLYKNSRSCTWVLKESSNWKITIVMWKFQCFFLRAICNFSIIYNNVQFKIFSLFFESLTYYKKVIF